MSSQSDKLHAVIDPVAKAMGYDVVRIALLNPARAGAAMTLQIMAERPDGTMLIEDCEKLSREVSVILDVEDPIAGEYMLEVSTPGIDRPLTRPKDFKTYAGHEVKIELTIPQDGRRRYRGILLGMDDNNVKIKVDGETYAVDFDQISRAKLVLTDALLAAASS